jgi:hypothetical protein
MILLLKGQTHFGTTFYIQPFMQVFIPERKFTGLISMAIKGI